jgi:hypothetical protein
MPVFETNAARVASAARAGEPDVYTYGSAHQQYVVLNQFRIRTI